MHRRIWSIIAVLVGMVVGVGTVAAIETMGHTVYPPPEGMNFSDPEAIRQMVATLPAGALVFVVVGWLTGTFAGSATAAALAADYRRVHAGIIGGVLFAATIANLLMIPHPVWMAGLGLVGIPITCAGAARLVESWRSNQPAVGMAEERTEL